MARQGYSRGVRTALVAFSFGSCYWPACGEPLLRLIEGKYMVALDIAHIRAATPGGPRYDPRMSDEQRNDFPNLLYLCPPHHRMVDGPGAGAKYTVALLTSWKSEHETDGQLKLSGGGKEITPEFLETAVANAMKDRDTNIEHALARLEENDAAAAEIMRDLLAELHEVRRHGALLDPDIAAMLSESSARLANFADLVPVLARAAERIENNRDFM